MTGPDAPGEERDRSLNNQQRLAITRIAAAVVVALAFCLGVYLLLQAVRPSNGVISWSFLLLLPAAVSAFVAYVADPFAKRRLRTYLLIPVALLVAVVVISLVFLKEGAICVILLSPLWLAGGLAGSGLTWWLRRRLTRGRTYCSALLLAPLAALILEPLAPLNWDHYTVTRSIVVETSAASIWPLARGVPDVRPDEGRWNVSQDLIGLPRPQGALLVGEGVGAERQAQWAHGIRFRERITAWEIERRLSWRFIFDELDGWKMTDRHLLPDSPHFRVTSGGYRLVPLGPDRTRVILDTHFDVRTPMNAYSAIWGELFLGDLENNLLAMLKMRAENGA